MRRIKNAWLMGITLLIVSGWASTAIADAGVPTVWDPVIITTGELVDTTVTMTGTESPSLDAFDLSGSDYAAARLSPNTVTFNYDTRSDWTATFSPPVENLLLYVVFWRGIAGGTSIVTYDFDQPFTVLSGLVGTTVSDGNTRLSVPETIFAEGILQFTGPVSSLSVETNSETFSAQALTFGVSHKTLLSNIPTLSEWGMIAMAGILGIIGIMVVRRRKVAF